MSIKRSNYYGGLTPESLQELERGIGGRLPAEYRQFLLEHNGGVPEPGCFLVPDDEEYDDEPAERRVACFFAAHDREWHDDTPEGSLGFPLQEAWRDFAEEATGLSAVPIGKDWNGSYICISYAGEDAGRISFYDHDFEGMRPLAESFGAFLDRLRPCEEGWSGAE